MFKRILYILFVLLCTNLEAKKLYTEVPVLIHLGRSEQDDTFGFNLVEHLPSLIYKGINDGKITLWDSPKKQVAITPAALKNIESSNSVSFARTSNLFINELWSGTRRKTDFVIIGFSFLSETSAGKISFGFVDILEAFPILSRNYIPCNVNGPALLTFLDALYSRRYQFSVLQFGAQDFATNPAMSFKVKKDAFYSKKKVNGLYKIPITKMITYVIEKNVSQENDPGADCLSSIEKFLNSNKEVLFNIGGSDYFDYTNKLLEITITRIEITEIWEKVGNQITYKPYSVRIFANNKPLNTLSFEDIASWNLLINFKTLEDILVEKTFNYSIYKINKDLIPYTESPLYLKALREYKWSQVSNYVKYSRN